MTFEHSYTPEIVCPHCRYVFTCSYETAPDSRDAVECARCNEIFSVEVHVKVEYSTKKLPCAKNAHTFGDIEVIHITQETINGWAAGADEFWRRHASQSVPHDIHSRKCSVCGHEDFKRTSPGVPNPFEVQQ